MTTKKFQVARFSVASVQSFEQVLAGLEKGISRPNMSELHRRMTAAPSFPEFERVVKESVGKADLMEFLRLDLGEVLRKDPSVKAFKMVRIIAGNPLIMKRMAEHVPDVGSYAPVTILIYESQDAVHLSYDTMVSYLAPYGNATAMEVAKDLDSKVIHLLTEAAG